MSHDIFICYRRDGGEHLAARVAHALRTRGFSVFMDIEDLKSGKFNEALLAKIDEATDFIAILTPGCLDRCTSNDDWVRLEIAHAIKSGKNLVPLIGRGFQMPASTALPTDISTLPLYNALAPVHELFDASIDRLSSVFLRSHPRAAQLTVGKASRIAPASDPGKTKDSFEVGAGRLLQHSESGGGLSSGEVYEGTIAHTDRVTILAVSPDGKLLASGSDDQTVKLWGVDSAELIRETKLRMNRVNALAISPDSQTLFVENCSDFGSQSTVQLWRLPDGQFTGRALEGGGGFMRLAVAPTGGWVVGCGRNISLWDLVSGELVRRIDNVENVHGIAISESLNLLVCQEYAKRLKIFGLSDGKLLKVMPEGADSCVITTDGRTLISCQRNTVHFWALPSGDLTDRFSIGSDQLISALAITPDGGLLAMGSSDSTIKLLSLAEKQTIIVLRAHSKTVLSLVISPDGRTLFSGGVDKTIRRWSVPEGKYEGCLNG
jgi:hypothetical protein